MTTIYFSGYWDGYQPAQTAIRHTFPVDTLRCNIHSVQVFGKRFNMEENALTFPSFYRRVSDINVHPLIAQGHTGNNFVFLFQGENPACNLYLHNALDHYVGFTDISVGPFLPKQLPTPYNNYLRFPFYCNTYMNINGFPTLTDLENWIAKIEGLRKENPFKRQYICSLVASHDSVNYFRGVRKMIMTDFSDIIATQPIISCGNFARNSTMLQDEFGDNKEKFLQNFVFNICPENSYTPGYVTEKIFQALNNGCVPIYWGGLDYDLDIFNIDAILYYDPHNPDKFKNRLKTLINGGQEVADFVAQNVFHPGAAAKLFLRYYYPLALRIMQQLQVNFGGVRANKGNNYLQIPKDYNIHQDAQRAYEILRELGLDAEFANQQLYLCKPEHQYPFTKKQQVAYQDYLARLKNAVMANEVLNLAS